MSNVVTVDRLQFALTAIFHYLFPILTMGLGLFIAWLATVSHWGREDSPLPLLRKSAVDRARYDSAARFLAKIFAVNFAMGVVTGIPLEFQFGTNWAKFSNYAGGVIGQTLAMEGVFAFFAESTFLGVFLSGWGRVRPRLQWFSAVMVFLGSWVSGFFIIATNAWMMHPVAYAAAGAHVELRSFWGLLTNPWLGWEYAHNMSGAAIAGAFALAGLGALYLLLDRHHEVARILVKVGVVAGFIFCVLQIFPTGDRAAHNVARMQPSAFASMEGLFQSEKGAPLVIIGNPDPQRRRLESTIEMPQFLSFLTSHNWNERLTGLDQIPTSEWPSSVPLVYYAYHIMVGLGTIFVVIAGLGVLMLRRGRIYASKAMLWALMLAFPFTYIANLAGWVTAEAGRQPWVIFGLLRTSAGISPSSSVPSGIAIFSLLGFLGLYVAIGVLFPMFLVRIISRGPDEVGTAPAVPAGVAAARVDVTP
jgi:cytochrome bd ubiquinol oxidase subunit I